MSRKKNIINALGVALLGAILYLGVWPFIVGGSHMETFCRSLTAGLSVAELEILVADKGYRLTAAPKEQRAIVHDSRSMGRYVCDVELRSGRLTTARYSYND